MAEKKRFELLEGYKPSPVFKTGAFGHSATSPHRPRIIRILIFESTKKRKKPYFLTSLYVK
jgi:hypothetical protein